VSSSKYPEFGLYETIRKYYDLPELPDREDVSMWKEREQWDAFIRAIDAIAPLMGDMVQKWRIREEKYNADKASEATQAINEFEEAKERGMRDAEATRKATGKPKGRY
jgi:hypothetical protein